MKSKDINNKLKNVNNKCNIINNKFKEKIFRSQIRKYIKNNFNQPFKNLTLK